MNSKLFNLTTGDLSYECLLFVSMPELRNIFVNV